MGSLRLGVLRRVAEKDLPEPGGEVDADLRPLPTLGAARPLTC
jgi:hypothetical protein